MEFLTELALAYFQIVGNPKYLVTSAKDRTRARTNFLKMKNANRIDKSILRQAGVKIIVETQKEIADYVEKIEDKKASK
jgi:hypothetical protein